jgi:Thermostable hemolysin
MPSRRIARHPLEAGVMLQMDLTATTAGLPGLSGAALPAAAASRFSVVAHGTPQRNAIEARVRAGFGAHFGACIEGFMPDLALYRHDSGATGVIGFRCAAGEELFLEQYLTRPIEHVVARVSGDAVERRDIVEVGQFVIDDRNAVPDFFRDLVPFLAAQGFDWICFTGTNRIRAILARIGFVGMPVAKATADRVRDNRDAWGTYYDNEPIVIVGKLCDPRGRWCWAANGATAAAAAGTTIDFTGKVA